MTRVLTGALIAATVAGTSAATTIPAVARDHGGGAVAAGILGLGVGAALASRPYYYGPSPYYYGGPAYYDGYGCHRDWRWSYRWRRYERVTVCY